MNLLKLFVVGLMSIATTPLDAAPTDDFITTWKTDNPGTSNSTSITVPMIGGPYDVDWNNDGVFDQFGISNSVTHDYGVAGTYTIRIFGSYDSIRFADGGDKGKILSLDQWGTGSWTSMESAFHGVVNLLVPAADTPDFSVVTDMSRMFYYATSANPDTSGWDTSAVTDMVEMFRNAFSFDQDLGSWNVSSLEYAARMFDGVTLSTANYESLLIGWNAQTLQSGVTFSGGSSKYCSAAAITARANMVESDAWIITDGGNDCTSVFKINAGVNDAWYDPETDGQGFFITVFPDLDAVSLAWFTYDTELPAEDATANLGDPGHRWLTAVGPIAGNQATMDIEMTSGGLFDTATVIDRTDPPGWDGSIILTFTGCNSATVEYDIPSINKQGIVPIRRVANDNIVICEALSAD